MTNKSLAGNGLSQDNKLLIVVGKPCSSLCAGVTTASRTLAFTLGMGRLGCSNKPGSVSNNNSTVPGNVSKNSANPKV
jgi:hypothetical protein